MKAISRVQSYDNRVRFFRILVCVSAASLSVYMYAVLATVHHTVSREGLLSQSQSLSAEVSALEYKDIAMKNTLSLDVALAKGFSEVTKPIYVSRERGVLTLNTVSR